MQFNQINYFLRTCDTLNFTRAAEICHVSQPSLSAAIQKLESELGGELFDRSGKTIQLTPLGESMRMHLSRIEEARNAANIAASHMAQGKPKVINLGFMCTLSPNKLLSAVGTFGNESQNVELLVHDVWEFKALDLLVSGAVDCVLMAHSDDLPDLYTAEYLADDPIVVAVNENHRLANQDRINISDLQGERYIDRLRCEFREQFFKELGIREIQIQVVLRSEREDLVASAISSAVGITIMPKSAAQNSGLAVCQLSDLQIVRKISMVTARNRQLSPEVHNFIEQVRQEYRGLN